MAVECLQLFDPRGASQVFAKYLRLGRNDPGYAPLPARSLGGRRIYKNQTWYASPLAQGRLIPINRSFAETARWKRRVPRFQGVIAMIRTGPPVPPLIFIGNAISVAPFAGRRSRFATFSRP